MDQEVIDNLKATYLGNLDWMLRQGHYTTAALALRQLANELSRRAKQQ